MKRNGGRERQNASKQVVGRQYRQDYPGKWTHEENKGLNSASGKTNHLLQGEEDPSATELQCISGLETEKNPLENMCRKIYSAHCIHCTHSTYRERKRKEKMKNAQEAYTAPPLWKQYARTTACTTADAAGRLWLGANTEKTLLWMHYWIKLTL